MTTTYNPAPGQPDRRRFVATTSPILLGFSPADLAAVLASQVTAHPEVASLKTRTLPEVAEKLAAAGKTPEDVRCWLAEQRAVRRAVLGPHPEVAEGAKTECNSAPSRPKITSAVARFAAMAGVSADEVGVVVAGEEYREDPRRPEGRHTRRIAKVRTTRGSRAARDLLRAAAIAERRAALSARLARQLRLAAAAAVAVEKFNRRPRR